MPPSFTRRAALLATAALLAAPHVLRAQPAGRRLRLGHITTADSSEGQHNIAFAREVAARTGGRWRVDVFPNATLGGQTEMLNGIATSTLDLGTMATLSLGGAIPAMEVFGIPFLFRDLTHARAVIDGPVAEAYRAAWASKDLHLLGWGELGVRNMTANRPVTNATALAGLKLRVPPSPVIEEVFRAMGAQARAVPWGQTADALRTGAMEAQENPIGIIASARLNEVQSHLMLTSHGYTPLALLASPDVMEDLNEEDRAHFMAAAEVAKAAGRAAAETFDREGVALLRQRGMTVIENPDIGSFRAARELANERLAAMFGAETLRRFAQA